MARTVKIDMNIGMPDLTIKKAKKAFGKHTILGAASPLTGFVDMLLFNNKTLNAETLRKNAEEQGDLFQGKYNQAEMKAGTGPGQTIDSIGTIYYGVAQVRGILLVKHRLNEELLQQYGFNVVITQTGARRNVRVDIPDGSPEKMVELGQAIVDKHALLGAGSPLTGNIDMTAFANLVTDTAALLGEWEAAKDEAQSLHNQAIVIVGYGPGQTKDTAGTIYFDRCSIRDRLLQHHQGTEEQLTAYGFDVVISEHAAGKKSGGLILVKQIEVPIGLTGLFDFEEAEGQPGQPVLVDMEAIGSDGLFFASATTNGVPGAGPVLAVTSGNKQSRTPNQLSTELGLGELKPNFMVQNSGNSAGIYKVTLHFAP